jgi:CBS domain-containing protein
MTAGEVCSREVVIARADEMIAQAARRIRECHVGTLVIVDDREGCLKPVGILTDRDIVIQALAETARPLYTMRVGEVMSANLVTAGEDESLPDVLKKMRSFGVRRMPIVNAEGGLEGILSFDDVVELLAEELSDLAGLIAREQKHEREVRV